MTTPVQARIWPEQVRLPGQVGAPAGPLDLTVPYAVHHAVRSDLHRFAAAVRLTPVEDDQVWEALADRWRITVRALRHEVAAEDLSLWPLVLDRGGAGDRVAVQQLRHDQAVQLKLLDWSWFAFDGLARHPDAATRDWLLDLQARGAERVRRCLGLKERTLFAAAQRVLEPDEWRRLEREHFRVGMTPGAVDQVIWLAEGLPGPLRRDVFRRLGRAEELMWTLGRPPFRRREAVAFRYVD